MKKKPPPGATLIARLKEQRLAREQELARRQGLAPEAAEPAVANGQTPTEPAATPPVVEAKAETKLEAKVEAKVEAKKETPAVVNATKEPTVINVPESIPDTSGTTEHSITTVVVEASPRQTSSVTVHARVDADLLHREVDIHDLRPTTDDYFVLTDEIRLAGRFAAVGLIAQGLRLSRLKEAAIYKEHYQTFEEYCRKEHQMSATYAYRLIRMAEMAERVAELESRPVNASSDAMPDPFEVMISLGHRHLMALLPLEVETAQELLVKGIPLSNEESGDKRVPLSKATERQIREALKTIAPAAIAKVATKIVEKKSLVPEKQLIPALTKLADMLDDWALWLGGDPPPELQAARMERSQMLNKLAKRFRSASGRIADALDGSEGK